MKDILIAQVINIEDMVSKTTGDGGISAEQVTDPSRAPRIKNLFFNFQIVVIYLISILILASLLYGGFLYITSGGDSEKVERGKRVITGAIIAVFIFVGALAIYTLINKLGG